MPNPSARIATITKPGDFKSMRRLCRRSRRMFVMFGPQSITLERSVGFSTHGGKKQAESDRTHPFMMHGDKAARSDQQVPRSRVGVENIRMSFRRFIVACLGLIAVLAAASAAWQAIASAREARTMPEPAQVLDKTGDQRGK